MPKLHTGNYAVEFYDRYGSRLKGRRIENVFSYTNAMKVGEEGLDDEAASFSIDRRVFNSLDMLTRYETYGTYKKRISNRYPCEIIELKRGRPAHPETGEPLANS